MSGPLNQMSTAADSQVVAITALNLDPMLPTAQGFTRHQTYVQIDLRYHVGSVHVTPALNEQWFVQRLGKCWVLDRKLPFNTTALLTIADNPVPGQTQVGSTGDGQGPLHLNGSHIAANGPLVLSSGSSPLPDPTTVPPGSMMYDGTVPVYSDGVAWRSMVTGQVSQWYLIVGYLGQGTLSATTRIASIHAPGKLSGKGVLGGTAVIGAYQVTPSLMSRGVLTPSITAKQFRPGVLHGQGRLTARAAFARYSVTGALSGVGFLYQPGPIIPTPGAQTGAGQLSATVQMYSLNLPVALKGAGQLTGTVLIPATLKGRGLLSAAARMYGIQTSPALAGRGTLTGTIVRYSIFRTGAVTGRGVLTASVATINTPVYDATGTGYASSAAVSSGSWQHTAIAGAAIVAVISINNNRTATMTYGGQPMGFLGQVNYNNAGANGILMFFGLGYNLAPGGPQTVAVALSGTAYLIGNSLSYIGATDVVARSFVSVFGSGTALSEAVTRMPASVLIQAFGNASGNFSAPSGGINRYLNNGAGHAALVINEATTPSISTTFTATSSASSAWGGMALAITTPITNAPAVTGRGVLTATAFGRFSQPSSLSGVGVLSATARMYRIAKIGPLIGRGVTTATAWATRFVMAGPLRGVGTLFGFVAKTEINQPQTNQPIPFGATGCYVTLIGGGGGSNTGSGIQAGASGGGGGGYVSSTLIPLASLGSTYSVGVGEGGVAKGADGGSSTFTSGGISLIAGGGSAGVVGGSFTNAGGAGGIASATGITATTENGAAGGAGNYGSAGAVGASSTNAGAGGGGTAPNAAGVAGGNSANATGAPGGTTAAAPPTPASAGIGHGGAGGGGGLGAPPYGISGSGGLYGGGAGGTYGNAGLGAGGDGLTLIEWVRP